MDIFINPPSELNGENPLKVVLKYRRPGQKVFGRRVAPRLKLTVSEDGVLVTAPQRISMRAIHEFVLENWHWVQQQLDRRTKKLMMKALVPGALVRIYGVHRKLVIENRETGNQLDSANSVSTEISTEISGPKIDHVPQTSDDTLAAQIRFELFDAILVGKVSADVFQRLNMDPMRYTASYQRALVRFAEGEARLHLAERIRHWSAKMGLYPTGISFRKQKTRWGSCSSNGHISLNWKLIFAPEAVIDYVVIHELAHLRHQNHSPAFWQLVEQYDPEAQRHRRWLRAHQNETHLFG